MDNKYILLTLAKVVSAIQNGQNTKDEILVIVILLQELIAYLVYFSISRTIPTPEDYKKIKRQTMSSVLENRMAEVNKKDN